jgi:hypothetical protein
MKCVLGKAAHHEWLPRVVATDTSLNHPVAMCHFAINVFKTNVIDKVGKLNKAGARVSPA